ncbi:MAG TPA: carbohydrate-binding protein [Tepidisphaeraceae bacterium]|nr:carbohydrate-binding protein [Tepidisphaeraceae bacterium]
MSVATNSAGWTVVTPNSNDRVIYCSSSTGNDSNTGLSSNAPVKTLAKAESMLRNGYGDEMLLKAGDVWQGNFVYWRLSGASSQDPMVLGSYGAGPRPLILTGTQSGLVAGSSGSPNVSYLSIMGIQFDADGRDPSRTANPSHADPTGINILSAGTSILIENCEVENYQVNINVQDYNGPISNVSIRRNVVLDAWSTDAHAQGLYVTGVNGLLVQGNDFDHNGWNEQVSGATSNWYNHDCYLSANNSGCVILDNIFANAAAYGLQARSGGTIEGNVFINDPIGMSFGVVNGAATTVGGVTGQVTNNVFIGGGKVGGQVEGEGMIIGNIRAGAGAVISGNIFTQSMTGAAAAIDLTFGQNQSNTGSVGINDLQIVNNTIYNWTIGIDVESGQVVGGSGINALNRVTISGNQFENLSTTAIENHNSAYSAAESISSNTFYNANTFMQSGKSVKAVGNIASQPLQFGAPNRSIASYANSLGISTAAGLLTQVATQSQQTWNPMYDASSILSYIYAGFSNQSLPPVTVTTPPVTTPPVTTPPVTTPPVTTPPVTKPTTPTLPTVPSAPTRSASQLTQALSYNSTLGNLSSNSSSGAWAEYSSLNFSSGVSEFYAAVAAVSGHTGTITMHIDSPTGTTIGALKETPTGATNIFTLQSAAVSKITGVHNLYLVFSGGAVISNLQWFMFS